ncbi:alcohol dehydrogenase [Paramesorhizobium deserti]|uniref:Alcohol dehydrogenase n=1 Tax=Paramesorhizobium deserti TaxID=1494590 RepID=A0A135HV72_9HYPH|nr:alcohol dehydrogenase catalytic domain-containing protein [Paramesorhizobium deserti]KXF77064.1 alcohol dehydrogenase [Paramesorhizobium deserti]
MSRALFIRGAHDAYVAPFNLREGGPGEVLIDVGAVGLCGSDLHYFKDGGIGSAVVKEPFVPGHEFGGYLCEDLDELGLARGALVAVDPNKACGHCEFCERGHANLCPNVEFIGAPPFNGAMTERIWVPKSQIVPLPQQFSPLEAVMLEPLGVAIHAVDLAKPRLLEQVALIGCGPIGLLILQVLKAAGAGEILAVDPQEHRQAMAARMGASRTGEAVEDIREWTKREGAPLVIEATNSPLGFRDAVLATKIGGRIVLVGIPDGDTYTLPAAEARRRGLKIKFARRMGEVYPRAIELVAGGKVDVASMVTHQVGLDEAPDTFRNHADNAPGYIKSLIYPNGLPKQGG